MTERSVRCFGITWAVARRWRKRGGYFPKPRLEGWGGIFQARVGVGLSVSLVQESSTWKGLEGRDRWSVQEQEVIRSQWPEFEGKVMKDEAAQVRRATCSRRVLSAWVTWLVFSFRNVILENDMGADRVVKRLLHSSRQEMFEAWNRVISGVAEACNNLRVI